MSKKLTYKLTKSGCNIQIEFSDGKLIGGKIDSYEFYCNCTAVKVIIGGHIVDLEWNSYVGSESFDDWKDLFTCSDSVEETELEKTYSETITRQDPENPKGTVNIVVMTDSETGLPCYYLESDLNTLINIDNYPDMSNRGGLPVALKEKTTGEQGFEWCPGAGTYTMADVLAEATARLGTDFQVDGAAPNGLLKANFEVEYKGLPNEGKTTTSQFAELQNADSSVIASINGGQSHCLNHEYIDEDCDSFVGKCVDLTKQIVVTEGTGLIVTVNGANCDTDDGDVAVQ